MSILEKRKVARYHNVLIVNFRQVNKSREYLCGIANNYSHKGINIEAACIEANPGEELEVILKNPYSELSITVIGAMVWKIDGWYKCITGINLKDVDQEAINEMKGLMTDTIRVYDGPPLLNEEQERLTQEDNADIVVVDEVSDEIAPEAETISPDYKSLCISSEEADSRVEERAVINKYRYRTDNVLFISILIGLFLGATAIFALTTLKIRPGYDDKIKPHGLSVSAAVQKPHWQKGEIKFDSDSDFITPEFHLVIDKFAKAVLRDPGVILQVDGYSDTIGPELYNLDLAMRRALKVKKLLMGKGIKDRRIKVGVYGESYPVSSNIDELNSAVDRRVDITIVPSPGY